MDERLRMYGIAVPHFPCFQQIKELRKTANALKHASEEANRELVSIRPDPFCKP